MRILERESNHGIVGKHTTRAASATGISGLITQSSCSTGFAMATSRAPNCCSEQASAGGFMLDVNLIGSADGLDDDPCAT